MSPESSQRVENAGGIPQLQDTATEQVIKPVHRVLHCGQAASLSELLSENRSLIISNISLPEKVTNTCSTVVTQDDHLFPRGIDGGRKQSSHPIQYRIKIHKIGDQLAAQLLRVSYADPIVRRRTGDSLVIQPMQIRKEEEDKNGTGKAQKASEAKKKVPPAYQLIGDKPTLLPDNSRIAVLLNGTNKEFVRLLAIFEITTDPETDTLIFAFKQQAEEGGTNLLAGGRTEYSGNIYVPNGTAEAVQVQKSNTSQQDDIPYEQLPLRQQIEWLKRKQASTLNDLNIAPTKNGKGPAKRIGVFSTGDLPVLETATTDTDEE